LRKPIRVAQAAGNLEFGGMQRLVLELMKRLDRNRFDPMIVYFREPNHFAEQIASQGWKCVHVPLRHPARSRDLRAAAHAIEKERIDLLHAHASFAILGGGASAILAHTPRVIAHYHGYYKKRHTRRLRFFDWQKVLAPRMDALVACSRGVEQFLRSRFRASRAPIRTILNGVDLAPFMKVDARRREEARARLGIDPRAFHIVHVGRLDSNKAPERLLRALRLGGTQLDPVRVSFVGSGSARESLEREAAEMGLAGLSPEPWAKRIQFVGWTPDVVDYFASADLSVLFSRGEGLPLVIVEAMAAGVPVLAADIPGTREVITPGVNGILADAENTARITENLIRVRHDTALRERLAQAGKQRAADFDIDRFVHEVEALYEDVLARPGHNTRPLNPVQTAWFLFQMRTAVK